MPLKRMKPAFFKIAPRGVSLIEALGAAIIIGMITLATATLFASGERLDDTARWYNTNQTDLRTALHTMTRTIRHAYSVQASGTLGNLSGNTSSASQIVCLIPQPGAAANIEVKFYLSGNTLYYQRSTDTAPGTALITDATGLAFTYYTTTSGTTAAAATPSAATEVEITLTVKTGSPTTVAHAYVELRN